MSLCTAGALVAAADEVLPFAAAGAACGSMATSPTKLLALVNMLIVPVAVGEEEVTGSAKGIGSALAVGTFEPLAFGVTRVMVTLPEVENSPPPAWPAPDVLLKKPPNEKVLKPKALLET
jgi:hypothetical protein